MSDWAPIPSSQAPGHGRGMPVWVKAAKTSVGAVALAVVVGSAIVLWPLAAGSERIDGLPGATASPSSGQLEAGLTQPLDSSRSLVSQLGSSYLFTAGRRAPVNGAPDTVSEPVPVATREDDETPEPVRTKRDIGGVRVVRVESPEAVGGDVQKSFRELVLRAIHSDRSGRLVALIDFAGTPAGAASLRVGPGDRFTEPKHKEADWSVVAIDPDRNRVVLERKDRRVALALFGTGLADLSPVVIAPRGEPIASTPDMAVSDDGTVIVRQSPDEAIATLRAEVGPGTGDQKPITFDDLAELLRAFGDLERYGERAKREQLERERR